MIVGAIRQGGQEEDQRGGDLSDKRIGDPAGGRGLGRKARRVASLETLLQCGVPGEAAQEGASDGRAAGIDGRIEQTEGTEPHEAIYPLDSTLAVGLLLLLDFARGARGVRWRNLSASRAR